MLAWLAGAAQADSHRAESAMPTADTIDTPAHVFAARAFKYRLWGTPKPPDTTRARPRSASLDARPRPDIRFDDTLVSPSKRNGILLTPGTATTRKAKTVSFGKDEKAQQDRSPSSRRKSTGSEVLPGRFPTPSRVDLSVVELPQHVKTTPSAFVERLKGVRSTPLRKGQEADHDASKKSEEHADAATVQNDNWKKQYEEYTTRTEREVRKLIAKQQAAKHFARDKDHLASELSEKLQHEHKKVIRLETQVNALQAQILALQAQLKSQTQSEIRPLVQKTAQDRTLESRFDAIRTSKSPHTLSEPAANIKPAPKPAQRPAPLSGDIWADVLLPDPSTPARQTVQASKTNNPLQKRDINTLGSHTPTTTPPQPRPINTLTPADALPRHRSRAAIPSQAPACSTSPDLPQPSPGFQGSSPFHSTPRARPATTPDLRATFRSARRSSSRGATAVRRRSLARMSVNKATTTGKENEGAVELASRKDGAGAALLNADRIAKAAERIAARKREREATRGRAGFVS